MILNTLAMIL